MPHVELKNVSKNFGAFTAIRDLSVAIEKGSFVALLGPSGCGKSTLLRMIAGLEDVSAGSIWINGQDVTDVDPARRRIAMVFQSYALYPHMTVRQNISFSLSIAGRPKREIAQKSLDVAQMLQLGDLLDRKPAQLSGGQRQRVAIGRALVRQPEVFLFDEPLSNLDALLRVQMRIELGKLHRQLGATMVYVTHDQVEAMTLADRIVVLDKGVISQVGTPLELYNRPANKFVASFIGAPAMNFLRAELHHSASGAVAARLLDGSEIEVSAAKPLRDRPGASIELGIRPEHIRLTPGRTDGTHIHGIVQLVERLGNSSVVYLETSNGALAVQGDGGLEISAGDKAGIVIDTTRLHLFGGDGLAIGAGVR